MTKAISILIFLMSGMIDWFLKLIGQDPYQRWCKSLEKSFGTIEKCRNFIDKCDKQERQDD